MELRNEHGQVLPGRESRMWLNARNNFPRQASFELELPEQPEIRLRERRFSFSLEAGERACCRLISRWMPPSCMLLPSR